MPTAMLIYGIHKPRYVSDSAVIKYYNRLGLQDEIYRIKAYNGDNYKPYRYLGNSMPDVLLFNSTGQLTKFEIDCSSGLDSIIALSPHDIDHMPCEEKSLQDFIGDTYVINNMSNEDLNQVRMPLYVVKFAEYMGRLNKDNVPEMVDRLSRRTDIKYIVLNMDYSVQE